MSDEEKKLSIPNPLHYTGRFLEAGDHAPAVILTIASAMTAGIFAGIGTHDALQYDVDAGTEMQAELLAEHQQDLADLKAQKLQLDLVQAQHAIKVNQNTATDAETAELGTLQEAFEEQAHKELMDIYLQGASNDGAALGEAEFANLHKSFMDIAAEEMDFEGMGYETTINPDALHEMLEDVDLSKTSSSVFAQHNAMQEINQKLHDERSQGEGMGLLVGFAGGIGSLIATMFLLIVGGDKLTEQPSRIQLGRRRKRHMPKNMNH